MSNGTEVFRQFTSVKLSNGKAVNLRALGIGDFANIEQEALRLYRRDMIRTWTDNVDLMPTDKANEWIHDAFTRAEKISLNDLPSKTIIQHHPDDMEKPADDRRVLRVITNAPYANYWMGEEVDGQIYSIWLAAKHDTPGVTIADIDDLFRDDEGRLSEADLHLVAQTLGELSAPKIAGNGQAPHRRRRKRGRG